MSKSWLVLKLSDSPGLMGLTKVSNCSMGSKDLKRIGNGSSGLLWVTGKGYNQGLKISVATLVVLTNFFLAFPTKKKILRIVLWFSSGSEWSY